MSWKNILKMSPNEESPYIESDEDWEQEIRELIEQWGMAKDAEDYEYLLYGAEIQGDTTIDVTFEDYHEGDMTEELEIFEEGEGHFRIEFSYKRNEFAMADYTLNAGFQIHEFNPEVIGGEYEKVHSQLAKM